MNVLIVGLGSIAHKHIQALKSINPNVQLFALRSSVDSNEIVGIKNIYHLSAIPSVKFDFAIIANPTACHQETIASLIPLNIPLFIEKPLFDKLDAGTILDDVRSNGIQTYVACNLRFLGCLKFAKEFIQNKRINEVNSYCGSYLPDWRPGQNFRNVYSANKEMGGGVHIDLIHEIDYMYWLFGSPKHIISTKTNKSSLHISAIDYANYLFEYPDFSANIILNYYRRDAKRSLEIITDENTIYVNLLKNEVMCNSEIIFSSTKTILDTYEDQLRFFINNVLQNNAPFNSIGEAYEILKLCIQND